MSEIHKHWAANCSDKRLLSLLSEANRLAAEGTPLPDISKTALDAIKAESEARGIGAAYRPWYF